MGLLACCLVAVPLLAPLPAAAAEPTSDQQRIRTYMRTAVVDAVGTAATAVDVRGCRDDRTACAARLRVSRARIQGYERELDAAGTPPACLTHADDLLRSGLDFAQEGLGMAADAVEAQNGLVFAEGAALYLVGVARTVRGAGQAVLAEC